MESFDYMVIDESMVETWTNIIFDYLGIGFDFGFSIFKNIGGIILMIVVIVIIIRNAASNKGDKA